MNALFTGADLATGFSPVSNGGQIDGEVERLIGDWEHLDSFVGQVGTAFYQAENERDPDSDVDPDQVFTVTVGEVLEHGQVGYAAAGDARAEAERLAGEYLEMDEPSVGEFEAWVAF